MRLRWLESADAPALHETFGDSRVTRFMALAPIPDREAAEAFIEQIGDLARADTLYQWGIALQQGDHVIGTVTLACLDRRNRRAEVGFALAHARWGQGFAREAVTLALHYAFGPLDLHRVEADVDPLNVGSLRLVERLGFQREGYLPERWWCDGRWHDTVFFGLLARHWRARTS